LRLNARKILLWLPFRSLSRSPISQVMICKVDLKIILSESEKVGLKRCAQLFFLSWMVAATLGCTGKGEVLDIQNADAIKSPEAPVSKVVSLLVAADPAGSTIISSQQQVILGQSFEFYGISKQDDEIQNVDVLWSLSGSAGTLTILEGGKKARFTATAEATSVLKAVLGSKQVSINVVVAPVTAAFNTPFSDLSLPNVLSLSDSTVPAILDGAIYTRVNPYSGKVLTVDGLVTRKSSAPTAIFLKADQINFQNNAKLSAQGQSYFNDSKGGEGGSGGGAPTGCGGTAGQGGSNGGNGLVATGGSCMGTFGVGWGQTYAAGYANYGLGGDGGIGTNSTNGTGSNGAGGGGGGTYNLWGGGSGGGGLVVIEANKITGNGIIDATGGNGRPNGNVSGSAPGGGGGGVVWVATREYSANLQAFVYGGKSNSTIDRTGKDGSAKIFQILPNGNLAERSFDDSWLASGEFTAAGSNKLPFPNSLSSVSSLADGTLSATDLDGFSYTRINPYSKKDLTVSGNISYQSGTPSALFFRVKNFILTPGTVISANGTMGPGVEGGSGGSGGAGSAGCGSAGHGSMTVGGVDGPATGGTCPADSGTGWGAIYSKGFDFGIGGAGGSGSLGAGAPGSNGAGGGGQSTNGLYGGAGGGGGLIAIVADSISGTGTLESKGGNRSGSSSTAGGGGGGVIWVAAKSYSGGITVDVSAGTGNGTTPAQAGNARIFQIMPDGSLVQRTFTDTW
jgi:hypothetical protein